MSINKVKENIGSDKLVIGTQRTLKELKAANLEVIFVTQNAPQEVVDEINHYAQQNETKVETLDIPNDELGVICKKPFSISVVSLTK